LFPCIVIPMVENNYFNFGGTKAIAL